MARVVDETLIERIAESVFATPTSEYDWSSDWHPEEGDAVYYGEDRDAPSATTAAGPAPDSSAQVINLMNSPQPIRFDDLGTNSYEQLVAIQRWADNATDLLNRGESDAAILAELAHDGCPDPQGALNMAKNQPLVEDDDFGQTDLPPNPAVLPTQPGMPTDHVAHIDELVTADRTVMVDGKRRAVASGTYTDLWGDEMVRVAYDDGGVEHVTADRVQEVADAVGSPVDEIRTFIEQFPEADVDSVASLASARQKVREAREMCRSAVFANHLEAAAIDIRLARQEEVLSDRIEHLAFEQVSSFGGPAPYKVGHEVVASDFGGGRYAEWLPEPETTDINRLVDEDLPIMMSEASADAILSGMAGADVLAHFDRHTASVDPEVRAGARQKVEAMIETVRARTASARTASAPTPQTDNDGPAEGIFW